MVSRKALNKKSRAAHAEKFQKVLTAESGRGDRANLPSHETEKIDNLAESLDPLVGDPQSGIPACSETHAGAASTVGGLAGQAGVAAGADPFHLEFCETIPFPSSFRAPTVSELGAPPSSMSLDPLDFESPEMVVAPARRRRFVRVGELEIQESAERSAKRGKTAAGSFGAELGSASGAVGEELGGPPSQGSLDSRGIMRASEELIFSGTQKESFETMSLAEQLDGFLQAKLKFDFFIHGQLSTLERLRRAAGDCDRAAAEKVAASEKELSVLREKFAALEKEFSALKECDTMREERDLARCEQYALRASNDELLQAKANVDSYVSSWFRRAQQLSADARLGVAYDVVRGPAFREYVAWDSGREFGEGFNLAIQQAMHAVLFREGVDPAVVLNMSLNAQLEEEPDDPEDGEGEAPAADEFRSIFDELRAEEERSTAGEFCAESRSTGDLLDSFLKKTFEELAAIGIELDTAISPAVPYLQTPVVRLTADHDTLMSTSAAPPCTPRPAVPPQ